MKKQTIIKQSCGRTNHLIKILKHPYGNITVNSNTILTVRNGRLAIDFDSIVSRIQDKIPYSVQNIERDLTKLF